MALEVSSIAELEPVDIPAVELIIDSEVNGKFSADVVGKVFSEASTVTVTVTTMVVGEASVRVVIEGVPTPSCPVGT